MGPLSPSSGGSATYTWNDLNGDGSCSRTVSRERFSGVHSTNEGWTPLLGVEVDRQRDLTSSYVDMYHFTVEHELTSNMVLSVGTTFKRDRNIIETITGAGRRRPTKPVQ